MEYIENWAWAIIMNPYVWLIAIASVSFDIIIALTTLFIAWRYHGTQKEED